MRKRRIVGRIYRLKYSWKGHKGRDIHKNRIKMSGQARFGCLWRWARRDTFQNKTELKLTELNKKLPVLMSTSPHIFLLSSGQLRPPPTTHPQVLKANSRNRGMRAEETLSYFACSFVPVTKPISSTSLIFRVSEIPSSPIWSIVVDWAQSTNYLTNRFDLLCPTYLSAFSVHFDRTHSKYSVVHILI